MLCAGARGCARPLRQGRSLLLCAQVCGRRPDARPARGQEAAFRQSRATCGGWRHCFLCHRAGPPLCPRGNKRGALATAALSVSFVSEQDHRYVQEVRGWGPSLWRHCLLCHRAGPPLCPRGKGEGPSLWRHCLLCHFVIIWAN